jgi:hypothetical protein
MKPWADFGPNDIETDKAPTLKDAVDLVAQLVQAREADGTALLVESGISFARWKVIYAAISTDEDPGLSAEEEKALLDGGFLRKKLVVCS